MDIYRLPGIMANVGAGSDALAALAAQNTGVEGFSDRGTEQFDGFDGTGTFPQGVRHRLTERGVVIPGDKDDAEQPETILTTGKDGPPGPTTQAVEGRVALEPPTVTTAVAASLHPPHGQHIQPPATRSWIWGACERPRVDEVSLPRCRLSDRHRDTKLGHFCGIARRGLRLAPCRQHRIVTVDPADPTGSPLDCRRSDGRARPGEDEDTAAVVVTALAGAP